MLGDLFGVESLLLVSLLALDSRQVLFVAPVLWLPTLVWKNDDERVHMGTKRVSLRLRAVLLVTFFLIATSVILGTLLARQSNDALKTLIDERMLDVVNSAADMIDGDALKTITDQDKGTEAYDKIYATLSAFEKNIGLEFIYTAR